MIAGHGDAAGRIVYAGIDGNGRSAIVRQEASGRVGPGRPLAVQSLWTDPGGSRLLTPGPARGVPAMDVAVGAGGSRALVSTFDAGYDSGMHRTQTLDLSVVLAGSVDFHVETGVVTLTAGDCVMVPGVLHRWHARDTACTLAVVMVGQQPA